jgi:predicted nucleic acid-binding protein
MKVFLDTSSLVKLYHNEAGTEELLTFLANGVDEIWLSELTMVEFRSALWKKVRNGELRKDDAVQVMNCFQNDQDKFRWVHLEISIMHMAVSMLMKYGPNGLRSLDSIQLACAVFLKAEDMIHLTSDTLLKSFFRAEHLVTIN